MIETFTITLVSILIGYVLGYISGKGIKPEEVISSTYKKIKLSQIKPGGIIRPDAKKLNKDPLVEAEEEAMRESFKLAGINPPNASLKP